MKYLDLDAMSDGDLAGLVDIASSNLDRRHQEARQKEQAYAAAVDLSQAHFERNTGWTATRNTPPHPASTPPEKQWAGHGEGWAVNECDQAQRIPAADPGASINVVLEERGQEYGDFEIVARTASEIRDAIMRPHFSRHQDRMPAVQREAIIMIATKLARIANGNPGNVDSWRDIAGYATLVVRDLEA